MDWTQGRSLQFFSSAQRQAIGTCVYCISAPRFLGDTFRGDDESGDPRSRFRGDTFRGDDGGVVAPRVRIHVYEYVLAGTIFLFLFSFYSS